ncbi:MAG TPA: DUF4129 domain-containing protein [Chitinophagaceae bacterium]|nr:DUF4129 domain-containing protein [Chitinophagaceae bacterium]
MITQPFHTRRWVINRFLLFLLFFMLAIVTSAQDVTVVDTVESGDYENSNNNDYDDENYQYRFNELKTPDSTLYSPYPITDSALEVLRKDDAFWYANTAPKKKEIKERERVYKKPVYLRPWFKNLVWVLIVASFIGVIIWFLIASDVRLFRKKPKALANDHEAVSTEDLFSIDYDLQLQKAIGAGDYRMGVRLMYLHVLRLMADKEIIAYKMERTNSDYLLQVSRTGYYAEFARLTRNFEYVWYGNFTITESIFEKVRQGYVSLKNNLGS